MPLTAERNKLLTGDRMGLFGDRSALTGLVDKALAGASSSDDSSESVSTYPSFPRGLKYTLAVPLIRSRSK